MKTMIITACALAAVAIIAATVRIVREDERDFRLESETAVIRMCRDNATAKPEFKVEGGQGETI